MAMDIDSQKIKKYLTIFAVIVIIFYFHNEIFTFLQSFDFVNSLLHKITGIEQDVAWSVNTPLVRYLKKLPLVLFAALILLTVWLLIRVLRVKDETSSNQKKVKFNVDPNDRSDSETFEVTQLDGDDFMSIVHFFLNLYKFQTGSKKDDPSMVTPLETDSLNKRTFEFKVRFNGQWSKRRMSIRPIGGGTGSKSKCFYVIFDDHLVVKIPPKPVENFTDYLASIDAERDIQTKIAPRECIVPGVSPILKKIHKFEDMAFLNQKEMEDRYLKWVKSVSNFQDYLKINGNFAFFMDLSRHFFLGKVISDIHDIEYKVAKEITDDRTILSSSHSFERKYGPLGGQACAKIQSVYIEYEKTIKDLMAEQNGGKSVHSYKIREWYMSHLAYNRLPEDEKSISPELKRSIDRIFEQIHTKSRAEIQEYRGMVLNYVQQKNLEMSIPYMSSLITNIIDLLIWLKEKQISMRDLKPDNMVVVGDPQQYPLFLRSYEDYRIGLIDVETAADLTVEKYREITQPLLGGTPSYATPSNFIYNSFLKDAFPSLSEILYLQDWYACIAIIYNIVTGKRLFKATANLLFSSQQNIFAAYRKPELMPQTIVQVSQEFWMSAEKEFDKKMSADERLFRMVDVRIKTSARQMLANEIKRQRNDTFERLRDYINLASFTHKPFRKRLFASNSSQLAGYIGMLERKSVPSRKDQKQYQQLLEFLKKVTQYKQEYEQIVKTENELAKSRPLISAYEISKLMFEMVKNEMYPKEWRVLQEKAPAAPKKKEEATAAKIDNTFEATIADCEKTMVDYEETVADMTQSLVRSS